MNIDKTMTFNLMISPVVYQSCDRDKILSQTQHWPFQYIGNFRSKMSANIKLLTRIKSRVSLPLVYTRNYSSDDSVKTALYDYHVANTGKMVPYKKYLLPVYYTNCGVAESHIHTRQNTSIFDVSHMLQTKIHGKDRIEFIESLTTADIQNLPSNKAALTIFPDATGGILDDLIVTNTSDGYLYVVTNAGCRDSDTKLLTQKEVEFKTKKKDVTIEFLDTADVSLIAVQGPTSALALEELCSVPIKELPFMTTTIAEIGGIEGCRISRCGYTGEDGFEISVPSSAVESLVSQFMNSKAASVKLAGLAVRDTLRIEAGLCLYGIDIGLDYSPVESSLSWLIPKIRRERKDFPGADIICQKLKDGPAVKRIGLRLTEGPSPRAGHVVETLNGEEIGTITSGIPSPSLKCNIAMAYIRRSEYWKRGSKVQVEVRGKKYNATVVSMPFLPTNYFTPK